MTIIISPHPDDAVLTLGQYMASTPTVVVTVFAGIPEPHVLSDYDASRGFTSSADAMRCRRAEDEAACALLGAEAVHLDFLDNQYGRPANDDEITAALRGSMSNADRLVFAPLGIGHPDHVQVARCARAARGTGTLLVAEELPYRVLWPEQVVDALDKLRAEGWAIADLPYPLDQGPRITKAAVISEYASQFPDEIDPSCLVPERVWRIAR